MKISIDREGCIECGVCASECPDVFELVPGEKAGVVEKYRANGKPGAGEVGEDLTSCARRSADSCPVSVISTEP